jgi:hypothetical protein
MGEYDPYQDLDQEFIAMTDSDLKDWLILKLTKDLKAVEEENIALNSAVEMLSRELKEASLQMKMKCIGTLSNIEVDVNE